MISATTREEWLALRRRSLGGSDVASAPGANPWRSPYQLWAEKTGLLEPQDIGQKESIVWGKKLEPYVADYYAETTGRQIRNLGEFAIQQHPELPFLTATLDRVFEPFDETPEGVLEIKTTGAQNETKWETEPPLYYLCQLQHQLLVTGMSWGSLAVLIGGQKFRYFDLARHRVCPCDVAGGRRNFSQRNTNPS